MIKLGKKYTDKITEYTGKAVNYFQHMDGRGYVILEGEWKAGMEKVPVETVAEHRLNGGSLGLDHERYVADTESWAGKSFTDSISQFKGKATCVVFHVNGCIQLGLEGKIDKNQKTPDVQLFDFDRLTPKPMLEAKEKTRRVHERPGPSFSRASQPQSLRH
jgi:hypothetical protein